MSFETKKRANETKEVTRPNKLFACAIQRMNDEKYQSMHKIAKLISVSEGHLSNVARLDRSLSNNKKHAIAKLNDMTLTEFLKYGNGYLVKNGDITTTDHATECDSAPVGAFLTHKMKHDYDSFLEIHKRSNLSIKKLESLAAAKEEFVPSNTVGRISTACDMKSHHVLINKGLQLLKKK